MALIMPGIPGFTSSGFYLQANTQTFVSPLSKATQRKKNSGERWLANYTLPAMTRDQYVEWIAFFVKLEGRLNTFEAFDPEGLIPRGNISGAPLVFGASQTGKTLIVDDLAVSEPEIFLVGDYFKVNGETKMITSKIGSDGSGIATLEFEPALRNSPADNAPILFENVTTDMILTTDDAAIFQTNQNGISGPRGFSAQEALTL